MRTRVPGDARTNDTKLVDRLYQHRTHEPMSARIMDEQRISIPLATLAAGLEIPVDLACAKLKDGSIGVQAHADGVFTYLILRHEQRVWRLRVRKDGGLAYD